MASFVFGTTRQPLPGKRERITVGVTVAQIDPATYTLEGTEKLQPRKASAAILQVSTDSIYFTLDGSTPDAATGFEAAAGDFIYLDSHQKIAQFKAVRVTGDAGLEVLPLFGA